MQLSQLLFNFFRDVLHTSTHLSVFLTEVSITTTLLVCSFVFYLVLKVIYHFYVKAILHRYSQKIIVNGVIENYLADTILKILPAFIIFVGSEFIIFEQFTWTKYLAGSIKTISLLYILYKALKISFISLNIFMHWLRDKEHTQFYLIKSIIHVVKIIIVFIGIIFAVSIILDKSPLILLTGLGAISAILMLVFKDAITGFVANIQASLYDSIRVGDWINMPNYGADGFVKDINISIVTVQNFDRTIVTVPTSYLMTTSVRNWRGMFDSGGRRIKRAIKIDISSIKFCDETLLDKLRQVESIRDSLPTDVVQAQVTNLGLFRQYVTKYLQNLPTINHQDFLMLVRHLDPTETGLPLEIYAFVNDTKWANYEVIQADIFEHLLATINLFELRIFQFDSCTLDCAKFKHS